MPVRKMRDISEATTPVAPRLRAENLREAFELSATALRLRPRDHIRGIRRYASIEEAAEDRDRPPRAEGQ
jgi:hypothetical protein